MSLREFLKSYVSWSEAIIWRGDCDLYAYWNECPRGDCLIWLLSDIGCDDNILRLISCAMVRRTPLSDGRTVWDLLTEDSRAAVEVAERYATGDATEIELATATESVADTTRTKLTLATGAVAWALSKPRSNSSASWSVAAVVSAFKTASCNAEVNNMELIERAAAVGDMARAAQADIVREMVPFETVEKLFNAIVTN
jgi:hypothetical protein